MGKAPSIHKLYWSKYKERWSRPQPTHSTSCNIELTPSWVTARLSRMKRRAFIWRTVVSEFTPVRQMSIMMGRSRNSIARFLCDQNTGRDSSGRNNSWKCSAYQLRALFRWAPNGQMSTNDLLIQLNLPISSRHIQQLLSEHPQLKYRKMRKSPMLSSDHRKKRLESARPYVSKGDQFWVKTVFPTKSGSV